MDVRQLAQLKLVIRAQERHQFVQQYVVMVRFLAQRFVIMVTGIMELDVLLDAQGLRQDIAALLDLPLQPQYVHLYVVMVY
jgi:hypothetical protein